MSGEHLSQPQAEPSLTKPLSSAKDQLTNQAVAVKKIMKPFSTPVLSKRTYRELKLLKHLRHENVRTGKLFLARPFHLTELHRSLVSATFSSPLLRTCSYLCPRKSALQSTNAHPATSSPSSWAPIFTACSLQDRLRSNSSNTSSTRFLFVPLSTRRIKSRLTKSLARIEIRPLGRRCPP